MSSDDGTQDAEEEDENVGACTEDYEKTLDDDIDEDTAFELLTNVQKNEPLLADFHESDIQELSKVLSFLKFPKGETIMKKGEAASFGGIILQGVLSVNISPSFRVQLSPGDIIGEMAFFEGAAARSADVDTGAEATLGVITYNDLSELGLVRPHIQGKLLTLFAASSINKLRKTALREKLISQMKPMGSTEPVVAIKEGVGEENKAEEEKKQKEEAMKKLADSGAETMLRSKMKAQGKSSQRQASSRAAAKQGAGNAVAMIKALQEKLDKALQNVRTFKQIAENTRTSLIGKISNLEQTNAESEARILELLAQHQESSKNTSADHGKAMAEARAQHQLALDQMATTNASAVGQLQVAMGDLQANNATVVGELQAQQVILVQGKDAEIVRLKQQLKHADMGSVEQNQEHQRDLGQQLGANNRQWEQRMADHHQDQSNSEASLRAAHARALAELEESMQASLGAEIKRLKALLTQQVAQNREHLDKLAKKKTEIEVLVAALKEEKKTTIHLEKDKSRLMRQLNEAELIKVDLKAFKTLLKYMTVHRYVTNYQMWMRARALLTATNKLVVKIISDPDKHDDSEQTELDGWNEITERMLVSMQPSKVKYRNERQEQTHTRKPMRHTRPETMAVLKHVSDVPSALSIALDQQHTSNDKWKATANVFLERNSEITLQMLEARAQLRALRQHYKEKAAQQALCDHRLLGQVGVEPPPRSPTRKPRVSVRRQGIVMQPSVSSQGGSQGGRQEDAPRAEKHSTAQTTDADNLTDATLDHPTIGHSLTMGLGSPRVASRAPVGPLRPSISGGQGGVRRRASGSSSQRGSGDHSANQRGSGEQRGSGDTKGVSLPGINSPKHSTSGTSPTALPTAFNPSDSDHDIDDDSDDEDSGAWAVIRPPRSPVFFFRPMITGGLRPSPSQRAMGAGPLDA